MKHILLFFGFCMCAQLSFAQHINVTYTVDINQQVHPISTFVYGINNGNDTNAKWMRWGGNRLSAYNWENNFSNAGADYINENDDYLPSVMNVPAANFQSPGACIMAFHNNALAQNAESGITLQMVGYVSNDGSGSVSPPAELAPSPRWAQVQNVKGSTFTLTPDVTDQVVYTDEELNFILNTYGTAASATGVKNYIMDNEPGLWCNQFPDMRTSCVTYNELFTKSIALAGTVKNMDAAAKVFGPESYGFNEYLTLQNAADDTNYTSDHWFVDTYLKAMKHASDSEARRLLDVFSVHWYPEPAGVYGDDTTQAVATARMQCTRTLWDSTYLEGTWISQYYPEDLPIIPHLQYSINQYYPGTKLAVNEYDYGAFNHISGGIAEADALGIFGKLGVDYAAVWNPLTGFAKMGFDLYNKPSEFANPFGTNSIFATSSDTMSTIYGSMTPIANGYIVSIILTNKSYTDSINASITTLFERYPNFDIHYFTRSDTAIQQTSIFADDGPPVSLSIPPLSVYRLDVMYAEGVKNINNQNLPVLTASPNPAIGQANIHYEVKNTNGVITIIDAVGKIVKQYTKLSGKRNLSCPLKAGTYVIRLNDGKEERTEKVVIE